MLQRITPAEFARRAGISRAGASKLFREGGKLHAAMVNGKVDVGNPDAQTYLQSKGVDTTSPDLVTPEHTETDAYPDDGSPQVMVDVQGLTLREIGERFGGLDEFSGWLKSIKLTEEIREKRLKNDETDGSMIDRETVEVKILGLIDETHRRLLTDAAQTATRKAYANAKAGVDLAKAEADTVETISTTLGTVKRRVSRNLQDASTTGDKGEPLGSGAASVAS